MTDQTDIVEQLRDRNQINSARRRHLIAHSAANEIETLRAERDRYRNALALCKFPKFLEHDDIDEDHIYCGVCGGESSHYDPWAITEYPDDVVHADDCVWLEAVKYKENQR